MIPAGRHCHPEAVPAVSACTPDRTPADAWPCSSPDLPTVMGENHLQASYPLPNSPAVTE